MIDERYKRNEDRNTPWQDDNTSLSSIEIVYKHRGTRLQWLDDLVPYLICCIENWICIHVQQDRLMVLYHLLYLHNLFLHFERFQFVACTLPSQSQYLHVIVNPWWLDIRVWLYNVWDLSMRTNIHGTFLTIKMLSATSKMSSKYDTGLLYRGLQAIAINCRVRLATLSAMLAIVARSWFCSTSIKWYVLRRGWQGDASVQKI